MIYVLHVSGQEQSMSSKSMITQGVLDTLLIMLECWGLKSNVKKNYAVKDDPCPSCLWSGTPNVLSHWWWQDSSWHTSIHTRMLKSGIQVMNQISRTIMRSIMTHVIHVSGQEPSISSKSLKMTGWFLTHFKSCKNAEIWHTGRESSVKNNVNNDQCQWV